MVPPSNYFQNLTLNISTKLLSPEISSVSETSARSDILIAEKIPCNLVQSARFWRYNEDNTFLQNVALYQCTQHHFPEDSNLHVMLLEHAISIMLQHAYTAKHHLLTLYPANIVIPVQYVMVELLVPNVLWQTAVHHAYYLD